MSLSQVCPRAHSSFISKRRREKIVGGRGLGVPLCHCLQVSGSCLYVVQSHTHTHPLSPLSAVKPQGKGAEFVAAQVRATRSGGQVTPCCRGKWAQALRLEATQIHDSVVWRSQVQNGSSEACSFWERPFLGLFQLLETAHIPWLTAPFHLPSQQRYILRSVSLSLSDLGF